jgi:hypothetical protein
VTVTTIRVVNRADTLKAEGLMLKTVHMSHVRVGYQPEGPFVSIHPIWAKDREVMHIIRPRSHKVSKADRCRSKTQKVIKGIGRYSVRKV